MLRRAGVTVQTTAGVTRIDIPPIPSIRYLRKHVIWIVFLGSFVLMASIMSVGEPAILGGAIEYGIILAIVVVHFAHRLRRHLLFEIDDGSLKLLSVRGMNPKSNRSWPRRDITEVRVITNGKLWVRAHHRQAAEIYLTPWRNVNESIAAELRAAIAASHAHSAVEKPELWYASSSMGEPEMPPVRKRTLLIISMVLCALGFLTLIFGGRFCGLSFFFFVTAAAPAGMALGTQDKDFYF